MNGAEQRNIERWKPHPPYYKEKVCMVIPTMGDRAMQALQLLALEPVAEYYLDEGFHV